LRGKKAIKPKTRPKWPKKKEGGKKMERFGKTFWKWLFFIALIGMFVITIMMLTTTVRKPTTPRPGDYVTMFCVLQDSTSITRIDHVSVKYLYVNFSKVKAVEVYDDHGVSTNRTKLPNKLVLYIEYRGGYEMEDIEKWKMGEVVQIQGKVIYSPFNDKLAISVRGFFL
jgi:hypothetical protein